MIGTQKRWQEDLFVAGPLSWHIDITRVKKQRFTPYGLACYFESVVSGLIVWALDPCDVDTRLKHAGI